MGGWGVSCLWPLSYNNCLRRCFQKEPGEQPQQVVEACKENEMLQISVSASSQQETDTESELKMGEVPSASLSLSLWFWLLLWILTGNALCFKQLCPLSHQRLLSKQISGKQNKVSSWRLWAVISGKHCPERLLSQRILDMYGNHLNSSCKQIAGFHPP